MAGVGKTAFAVRAARQLAPRFPDGQIFLPLHAHTPGQQPVSPLTPWPACCRPSGSRPRRSRPACRRGPACGATGWPGKRLLLVLDDAASSDQVRPLLPGTGGGLVLITSRRHLTALEDARVDQPRHAAAGRRRRAAGPARHPAGPGPGDPAVAEIAALCGWLPLALGMLARQLYHHPAWSPAELAADLAAARDRL